MRKNDRSRKPAGNDEKTKPSYRKEKKPFDKFRTKTSSGSDDKKSRPTRDFKKSRPESDDKDHKRERPYPKREGQDSRPWKPREGENKFDKSSRFKKDRFSKPAGGERGFRKKDEKFSFTKKENTRGPENKTERGDKKFDDKSTARFKKPRFSKPRKSDEEPGFVKRVKYDAFEEGRSFSREEKSGDKKPKKHQPAPKPSSPDGLMRLNKYLSNAGIASRRDADVLIKSGAVKVNGVVVDQMGYKINPGDKVTYGGESIRSERKVYLLLNKPKDYITTLDDPQERKTVMELISGVCRERIYPVGRLDRNTTGLLLFTNDGELTTKLTHPKYGIKKVYHVSLNKGLKPEDFKSITEGVELEDGMIKADDLAFVGEGKKEIGIEVHSGRNRIVRRLFEHLGYDVLRLDRVAFAGLTKKDLPRGKHRFLTAKEISFLQMIG